MPAPSSSPTCVVRHNRPCIRARSRRGYEHLQVKDLPAHDYVVGQTAISNRGPPGPPSPVIAFAPSRTFRLRSRHRSRPRRPALSSRCPNVQYPAEHVLNQQRVSPEDRSTWEPAVVSPREGRRTRVPHRLVVFTLPAVSARQTPEPTSRAMTAENPDARIHQALRMDLRRAASPGFTVSRTASGSWL